MNLPGPWVSAFSLRVLPFLALWVFLARFFPAPVRCRGCGKKTPDAFFAEHAGQCSTRDTVLCDQCRGLIEFVRGSGPAAAVFIFRYGKRVRYYVGWQPSSDSKALAMNGQPVSMPTHAQAGRGASLGAVK